MRLRFHMDWIFSTESEPIELSFPHIKYLTYLLATKEISLLRRVEERIGAGAPSLPKWKTL